MRVFIATILFVFMVPSSYAQKFTPGYYLDKSGHRHDGFLEDVVYETSPNFIWFKSVLTAEKVSIPSNEISEFRVNDNFKFQNILAVYDANQVAIKNEALRLTDQFDLQSKSLLAKVVAEGNITLYKAVVEGVDFFLVKTKDQPNPELLLHTSYMKEEGIAEVNTFRIQLLKLMPPSLKEDLATQSVKYSEYSLGKIVSKFNQADASEIKNEISVEKYGNVVKFNAIAGYSFNTISFKIPDLKINTSGVNSSSPVIGIEFQYLLGNTRKKLAIFSRLTFQQAKGKASYSIEPTFVSDGYKNTVDLDLKMINLSLGGNYALYQQNKHRVNFGLGMLFTKPFGSIDTRQERQIYINFDPPTVQSFVFTKDFEKSIVNLTLSTVLAYEFNSKYGIGVEYNFPRNLIGNKDENQANLSNISFFVTYNLSH